MTALATAKNVRWGTYGPGAVEAFRKHAVVLPDVRWVLLGDCDTDHLEAIQRNIEEVIDRDHHYQLPYLATQIILDSRKGNLCRKLLAIFSPR